MIQEALRRSVQLADRGEDLRQGDGRDHQLEAGEEDADAQDGEQHVRLASRHGGSVGRGRAGRLGLQVGTRAARSGISCPTALRPIRA